MEGEVDPGARGGGWGPGPRPAALLAVWGVRLPTARPVWAWQHGRRARLPFFPPRHTPPWAVRPPRPGWGKGLQQSWLDFHGTREQPHPLSRLHQPPDEAGMWRGGELFAPALGAFPGAPHHVGVGG